MNLERTLETQRVRLLRLVAGWITVLGVLSGGPLELPLPHWIRAFFETVLIRVELAAQFCLHTSALMQASGGLLAPAAMPCAIRSEGADIPSTQDLLRRMKALRDVFENLPHHARRLLRVRRVAGEAFDFTAPLRAVATRDRSGPASSDWTAPRVERPPDKSMDRFGWFGANSPCFAGGRRRGFRI